MLRNAMRSGAEDACFTIEQRGGAYTLYRAHALYYSITTLMLYVSHLIVGLTIFFFNLAFICDSLRKS